MKFRVDQPMEASPSLPERKLSGSGIRNSNQVQKYGEGRNQSAHYNEVGNLFLFYSYQNPIFFHFQANQELAQLFECPVCFDYVLPPIMQCNAGHLVCQHCQPKLTVRFKLISIFLLLLIQHCPTCRGQAPTIRNLAMEKVAATVFFPCKYHSSGCLGTFLHDKKVAHEGNILIQ